VPSLPRPRRPPETAPPRETGWPRTVSRIRRCRRRSRPARRSFRESHRSRRRGPPQLRPLRTSGGRSGAVLGSCIQALPQYRGGQAVEPGLRERPLRLSTPDLDFWCDELAGVVQPPRARARAVSPEQVADLRVRVGRQRGATVRAAVERHLTGLPQRPHCPTRGLLERGAPRLRAGPRGFQEVSSRLRASSSFRAGEASANPLRANGLCSTERRRSRTYRAVGYTTAPVLKTSWATGPMPLPSGRS
jgi:hypothetical protein